MSSVTLKCRICLADSEEKDMRPLFEEDVHVQELEDNVENRKRSISEQIECCCGVKLRKTDEIPSMICDRCSEFLRMWYRFRQMCLDSEIYWKSDNKSEMSDLEEAGFPVEQFIVEVDNEMELENYHYLDQSTDCLVLIENESEPSVSQIVVLKPNLENDTTQDEIYLKDMEDDDFLSPTPSPKPKHKSGRPRKPDHGQSNDGNHLLKKKPDEGAPVEYECYICGNVYQKRSAFMAHRTTHADYKPHQCELCDKSFRQMGELRAHIRRHTGERPYKCLYCDRSFSDRSEKLRHERVHTNTRPYKCTVCEKTFTHSTILKNHSLVHSGKKNYNCAICSKSFTLLHQLKAHLQTLTHRNRADQQSTKSAIN